MRATYIEEEEMSDMCRHQREKLQGITQTGACYHCCPWMFPTKERIEAAGKAIEAWRSEFPMAKVDYTLEETPVVIPPEVRRRRLMFKKWNFARRARATA